MSHPHGRFARLEHSTTSTSPLEIETSPKAGGEHTRTAAHYLEAATEALHDGLTEQALQMYTKCLREDRSRIVAWVGQIQCLVLLNEDHEARLWCDKTLELFKNNGDLLACKAQALERCGDRPMAMASSDASLKATGSSALRWYARGDVMLNSNRVVAHECFQRALSEVDSDWFTSVQIARIHLRHDRPGPALEQAMLAKEKAPHKPLTWITLGNCHQALGAKSNAIACYKTAVDQAPGRRDLAIQLRDAHNSKGSILSTLRRYFKR